MPLLNPGLLRYMVSLATDAEALVPRWIDAEGKVQIETLHSIYTQGCIEPIRRRIRSGRLKVHTLFNDLNVLYLDEAEMRRYDPGLDSFRNVNTPEEWERLRSEL
jgi:molybdopterin-guanine dinucleotide biosynthesis protein A